MRGAAVLGARVPHVSEHGCVHPRGEGRGRPVEERRGAVRGAGAGSGELGAAAAGGVDEEAGREKGGLKGVWEGGLG